MFSEGMETASLPGKGRCSFIVIQCVGWFSSYCSCQSSGYRLYVSSWRVKGFTHVCRVQRSWWKWGVNISGKLSDSDPLIWQALPKKCLAVLKNWSVFLVKYPYYRCVAEMADKLVKPGSRSLTWLVTQSDFLCTLGLCISFQIFPHWFVSSHWSHIYRVMSMADWGYNAMAATLLKPMLQHLYQVHSLIKSETMSLITWSKNSVVSC